MMNMRCFARVALIVLFLAVIAQPQFWTEGIAAQEGGSAGQDVSRTEGSSGPAPRYTLDFTSVISKISAAPSADDAVNVIDKAVADCKGYDDYERLASEIKALAQSPAAKNKAALYYAVAKTRVEQISFLSKTNTIESGRLYMSVNDRYTAEALESAENAARTAGTGRLVLDAYFLEFLIFREKFQPEKSEALLEEMANRLSKYSDKSDVNKAELDRMASRFDEKALSDYAMKLKMLYASKVDPAAAQAIFEDIKKSGDQLFGQGNMRKAGLLYEQYIKTGEKYFQKEAMASSVMDIAERYFGAGRYKEARHYYESYMEKYPDSKVVDYCSYKIALCFYNEKDTAKAVAHLEAFLDKYKNSVWFDKAFEALCRLYYINYSKDNAIASLQRLVDNYYRKDTGDYANVLIALVYYMEKDYDNSLEVLKTIGETSMYSYSAQTIIEDIKSIKKGALPTFTSGSKEVYKMWEPYTTVNVTLLASEAEGSSWGAGSGKKEIKKMDFTYTESGAPQLKVKGSTKIRFSLDAPVDMDKYAEFRMDKEDVSRLPKEIRQETEQDILSIAWTTEDGSFSDEKQSKDKVWQAPKDPGTYKVSFRLDDLGLVRLPDKGTKKDSAKEVTIFITVENQMM